MSEKALNFNNIRLNKKEFHNSKEPIDLMSANLDQIVVSETFKYNNEDFSILLVTKKVGLLNHYVLFYLK